MGLAVAVTGVFDICVAVVGVEGDEAEAVGDELVWQDGGVGFDFYEVDCHGGDFSEDNAAEGIGEGEVDGVEAEVDAEGFSLFLKWL